MRSEDETRTELIDPMLEEAGWKAELVEKEYLYKKGRIRLLGDEPVREKPQYVDYLLRRDAHGLALAVVEAKDESHSAGAGLQQAMAYAKDLGVRFAYSSNGHGLVEADLATAIIQDLETFPTPDALIARQEEKAEMRGPVVTNRQGVKTGNPLIQPVPAVAGGGSLRYYQEGAVTAALSAMLSGHKRGLLSLATGTGKTRIGHTLAWKLRKSGYAEKILFLVDRLSLLNQAYNDFAAHGEARGIVASGSIPLSRDIHFATYQTLYTATEGVRTFERYPRDYFDLVIVDECHRSGYGDWGGVLQHFNGAFHLGLTATPKRADSIDTYEFFAAENRDAKGEPQPLYEYSLGQGIDDGFLATYQVLRVRSDVDANGLRVSEEVARGADLFVPEEATVRDVYEMAQFEREIMLPDRTQTLCEHLASKMRTWGVNDKTMIFCVSMEHAEMVRSKMQTLLGPEAGKLQYAVRIVSEERDAQDLLEEFQLSDSSEPVIATTVDLLSTGVNVPSCKNIVFMKPVGSPTLFKQIIGRGSRIDEETGKLFFRIVDYTGATRLFDQWDRPVSPTGYDGPIEGDAEVAGIVVDAATGLPVTGAAVSLSVEGLELAQTVTDSDGLFAVSGLPQVVVTVTAGHKGYQTKRERVDLGVEDVNDLSLRLPVVDDRAGLIRISGITVRIADEVELTVGPGTTPMTSDEYFAYVKQEVLQVTSSADQLAKLWSDPDDRQSLLESLSKQHVELTILEMLLDRPDVDGLDLLSHAAFGQTMLTREQRSRRIEQFQFDGLSTMTELQQEIVDHLLDKYRVAGVNEISSAAVFKLTPFADQYGGVRGVSRAFGGALQLRELLNALQAALYISDESGPSGNHSVEP
ncbi:EcoEI R domain-containing protein [Arthrobacter crystallopoietes BAB-32]|uniref:EcoEI R domain-containing protein n=1 Tax=Arthrobacter crystallopoietes BAB-32 TaxID=1246476 RepID=N1UYY0_9MICC|nr:DEAD/DEAH box helicase family protein [Arthrobacter crystallopoietes]EMY32994.1 EcoEI R domain-containing protein [Arthrobacter crystallopoietes BAB-32]